MSQQVSSSSLGRELLISRLVGILLFGSAAASLMLQFFPHLAFAGSIAFACVMGAWLLLSMTAARTARLAAQVPTIIAAGDLERAEDVLKQARARFGPVRSLRLSLALHQVMLRHAQERWADVASLGRELAELIPPRDPSARLLALLLADASLQRGDLRQAHAALTLVSGGVMPLPQTFELLLLKLDYLSRIGRWTEMLEQLRQKVDLAELMPAGRSAMAQALLALAANSLGRSAWAEYLKRRASLLAEPAELVRQRPVLAALWNSAAPGA